MATQKPAYGKSAKPSKAIDPAQLRKELDAGQLRPAYLLDGDDGFIRQRAFEQLRSRVLDGAMPELNEHVLTRPDGEQIAAAANIPPMMAERRLVVVRDYEGYPSVRKKADSGEQKDKPDEAAEAGEDAPQKGDPQIDKLLSYLDNPCPTTVLVFVEPRAVGGSNKLLTRLADLGGRVRFAPMDHPMLVRWVARLFQDGGCACDPNVIEQLIFTCGNDSGTLYQQAEKLMAYVGDAHVVTAADVSAFAARTAESHVFDMIGNLMQGRKAVCFQMMLDLLRGGTSPYALLAMLQTHFRTLNEAFLLLDSGVPAQEYDAYWNVKPYAATQRIRQAKLIGKKKCRAAFELCTQTDYRLKAGLRNEDGMIEALMLQLFDLFDAKETTHA